MKTALISGISGQTGSYLAEHLEHLGYDVHGLVRRTSSAQFPNLKNTNVTLHWGDMADANSLYDTVKSVMPDEVYNLAAQSFVKMSYITPVNTGDITGLGAMRLLEVLRHVKPDAKFYQAGTSELFGRSPAPQSETTPFHPVSPYSVAKLYAHWATRNYRETYNMFAVNGILFNHESPRRGVEFVSRKIARGVADIAKERATELRLGNLSAKRDWGHAKDYVRAIHLMMQHDTPDDWVIGTGESHTVGEFVVKAFETVGLDWNDYVVIDDEFKRPNEVNHLQADATKARSILGWEPTYTFDMLVKEMVESELMA